MLPSVQTKISTEEFQITDWASQIAELQARIAASQARITRLNEDNAVADGVLQAAEAAKGKISDQEVIADLLAYLSRLLGGGDNGDNGKGNLPLEPAPQPNDDGGSEVAIAVTPESQEIGEVEAAITNTTSESEEVGEVVDAIATEHTSTDIGEFLQPADNDGSFDGVDEDFADMPQMEVVVPAKEPKVEETAIAVETGEVVDTPKEPDYFELVPVGDAVAYFRNNKTGEIVCTYLGGNNKQKLKLWGEWLCHQHFVGSGFQLREAERLTAFKHEIKIWGMSLQQIQKLAESNTQKNPPSNFGTFPVRKVEPVAPAPKPLQIEDIEVGDIVRSTTINNWQYKVVGLRDGMFNCEQINVEAPIKVVMHPASVELVSKTIKVEDCEVSQHISIDVNDVPVGVKLELQADALITEYRVWVWCVVRVKGKPEVQQKSIGSLVESSNGINAYRLHGLFNTQSFPSTFDAIKHLVQAAGLKLADIEAAYNRHQEEVGLASIQPPVLQPQPVPDVQKISANDWVELIVNGDRYQVAEVDGKGIHLVTNDGNMLAQPDEVKLLMKIPATWQPF